MIRDPPPGPAAELNTLHAIVWNPADVERYGPAVLVDFEDRDGERLFVWTD